MTSNAIRSPRVPAILRLLGDSGWSVVDLEHLPVEEETKEEQGARGQDEPFSLVRGLDALHDESFRR